MNMLRLVEHKLAINRAYKVFLNTEINQRVQGLHTTSTYTYIGIVQKNKNCLVCVLPPTVCVYEHNPTLTIIYYPHTSS